MRILLIAYHYPPDPAVGAVRPARMVRALRESGHQVTVVSAALHGSSEAGSDPTVVRIPAWMGPRDLYRKVRARLSRGRRTAIGVDSYFEMNQYAAPESVPVLKRFVSSLMWLPDDLHGFIPPAFRHARRCIVRGDVDLVITTAPPFSVHVVGLLLRAFTGIPWIVDYRDPWQGGTLKPPHVRSSFSEAIEAWAERRTLRTADGVVAASNAIARLLRENRLAVAPRGSRDVIAIRNGFDMKTVPTSSRSEPGRRITYLGYLYLHRDPRPFLDALAALAADGRLDLRDIQVDFYGAGRWFNNISIADHVQKLGIAQHVRFFDPIGPEECAAVLADSTLLLLLAQKQPTQVPNKIYDYLAAGRPIVAFADAAGETAEMLDALGGHYVITDNAASEVERVVLRALSGDHVPGPENDELLREWSSECQMKRFVEFVEDVGAKPRLKARIGSNTGNAVGKTEAGSRP